MNYLDLINIKYSFKKGLYLFIALFIGLIYYIFNLNMYESYSTYGYIEDNYLVTKIIDNPDIINSIKYIKIGTINYEASIEEISQSLIDEENFVNYQLVKLKLSERLNNNEAFKFVIFYNEEKVYNKLKKIVF